MKRGRGGGRELSCVKTQQGSLCSLLSRTQSGTRQRKQRKQDRATWQPCLESESRAGYLVREEMTIPRIGRVPTGRALWKTGGLEGLKGPLLSPLSRQSGGGMMLQRQLSESWGPPGFWGEGGRAERGGCMASTREGGWARQC